MLAQLYIREAPLYVVKATLESPSKMKIQHHYLKIIKNFKMAILNQVQGPSECQVTCPETSHEDWRKHRLKHGKGNSMKFEGYSK